MSNRKSYAIFGLGRYGYAAAKELVNSGADVLVVDSDESIINQAAHDFPLCKCADVTDAEAIRQLGIASVDIVIIAMANHLEQSVMAIMLCKEAGVKTVIAKCSTETHRKILSKVGADKVVLPESESGARLAKNLLSSGFVDVVDLAKDISIIEMAIKPEWVGKTVVDLNLRKRYGINVIAIRSGGNLHIDTTHEIKLTAESMLVVLGHTSKLSKLS